MNTTPPTRTAAWSQLSGHAARLATAHLSSMLATDAGRQTRFVASAPGLRLDYSRQRLDVTALHTLSNLARERDLAAWREALFSGAPINTTEGRAAWHSALRAGARAPREVRAALDRVRALASRIRDSSWHGATGKPVRRLVHLGTGGSDLGPRLVVDALAELCTEDLEIRFAANIDPLDLDRVLFDADPERTLFIVVSKTFSTQETMENARAARRWLEDHLRGHSAGLDRHFIAVTENEAAARAFGAAEVLPIWDWVGGRYSVWSAVSLSAVCALGHAAFDEFLAGAADIDSHFLDAPFGENLPVLMALLGIWNVNFLGAVSHAVLPYSRALRLLPAYLQQLEMESNGKSIDREGRQVDYATAPVLWGAEGTVGQHSFHQLLHQGTQAVPADFIVFKDAPGDLARRAILTAHASAQAEALAVGRDDPKLPPHRRYPGNRPSSILTVERLDPGSLGRLIALYEHKVFVQGVIWNVNSFDQWGVEFGKALAAEILAAQRTPD